MLITIAELKARYGGQIGSSPDEDTLNWAIAQGQSMCEDWCGLTFDKEEGRVEYQDAVYHAEQIYLDKYNVDSTATFSLRYSSSFAWGDSSDIDTDSYHIDYTKGIIYLQTDYSPHELAWRITYTAGWTSANAPDALKTAVADMAVALYERKQKGNIGVTEDAVAANTRRYQEGIPPAIMKALEPYRRHIW